MANFQLIKEICKGRELINDHKFCKMAIFLANILKVYMWASKKHFFFYSACQYFHRTLTVLAELLYKYVRTHRPNGLCLWNREHASAVGVFMLQWWLAMMNAVRLPLQSIMPTAENFSMLFSFTSTDRQMCLDIDLIPRRDLCICVSVLVFMLNLHDLFVC